MATNENQNPNHTLPQDIIYFTLSKLPVKSLLRCMSVCKSWLSIISSDNFVKTHLSESTNNPHFTNHHLFIDKYANPIFKICSVHSVLYEPVTESCKIDSPNKKSWTVVVGYCNGLFCLSTCRDRVFLWNPFTGKSRKLPRLIAQAFWTTWYYFCYDELDNDFKVFGESSGDNDTCRLFFYSSKSDNWSEIGDFPFADIEYGVVSANRAFYWVVELIMDNGKTKRGTVVSLDIKTGTYREILQPEYAEGTYNASFSTFGKSLSVCYNVVKETRADFWVMNNCDVVESWMKLFTFSYGNDIPTDCFIKPLCICVNGDIMLSTKSQILLHKSKNNTFEVVFDTGSEHNDVVTCVESLVSPDFKP